MYGHKYIERVMIYSLYANSRTMVIKLSIQQLHHAHLWTLIQSLHDSLWDMIKSHYFLAPAPFAPSPWGYIPGSCHNDLHNQHWVLCTSGLLFQICDLIILPGVYAACGTEKPKILSLHKINLLLELDFIRHIFIPDSLPDTTNHANLSWISF